MITNTIEQLRGLGADTAEKVASELEQLLENSLGLIRLEGMQTTDFIIIRIGENINSLIDKAQGKHPRPLLPHVFRVKHDIIQLTRKGKQIVAENPIIRLTGFNFFEYNRPKAELQAETGHKINWNLYPSIHWIISLENVKNRLLIRNHKLVF